MFLERVCMIGFLCLLVPHFQSTLPTKVPTAGHVNDEQMRKDVERTVQDLNHDIQLRLKALESQAQAQSQGQASDNPTGVLSPGPSFQLTMSRGIPERGFLEKSAPILIPSLVSILTVLLTFGTQIKLQHASQLHQATLQRMSQENQQQLQQLAQTNQQRLQDLAQTHQQWLQREARWGTRQLEAAQEVWSFLEQMTATYRLADPATVLSDSIQVTAPGVRAQSEQEVSELINKQGFFLPEGSPAILLDIQEQLRQGNGPLAALKVSLEEIRQGLRTKFDVKV
jgi:hypothetical protein